MLRQSRYSSSLFEEYENDNAEKVYDEIFEVINTGDSKNMKQTKTMSIEEREILRKIDIRVIPLFSLLYIFSFIDKYVF
ncbi:hypothetical protein F8M41_017797 [Gigaspora margarita]|uniref:Uncharacterized protein n=1 Tax=Gigaspora margarita TaxID=4874 RepID=A0A8H4AMG9_GIGMA|nr:hypothetical protein F8M41_017797 [Gigaspora margarita]